MNEKILVVDDDSDIIELLKYNLQKEGFQVLVANNGKDAVALTMQTRPDLILMDMMMPQMSGLEASKIIKNDTELADIHLLFRQHRLGQSPKRN
jgi:two-component system alkaline phosphatase synthesis response regulator PhoP